MRKNLRIRKFLAAGVLLCAMLSAGETSIGGVALGDSFDAVLKKYPFLGKWGQQELTGLPYPLNVGQKRQVYLAQEMTSRIYFYFDAFQKVIAIGLFTANDYADNRVYETSAGLRPTDGLLELKVLYGLPLDITEYDFKDGFGDRVVRRLYYYPDMIVQTRKVNALPEQIDNVIVCQYQLEHVLQEKNYPLPRPGR
ncbi:MAG: hypothetical protein LBQ83_07765 [Candidatus Margulisbacteria bacterium]|jgi:hypothetical protein|nr:hypothetical protein [Candidatus Margulisiibacteriota bacterium]